MMSSEKAQLPHCNQTADVGGVVTADGGVASEEPVLRHRGAPQVQPMATDTQHHSPAPPSEPHRGSSNDPPGGFSLFLVVLLLLCIFILVARRLIMMYNESSS